MPDEPFEADAGLVGKYCHLVAYGYSDRAMWHPKGCRRIIGRINEHHYLVQDLDPFGRYPPRPEKFISAVKDMARGDGKFEWVFFDNRDDWVAFAGNTPKYSREEDED